MTMPVKFWHMQVSAETMPQAIVKKDRYSEGRPVWLRRRLEGTWPRM